MKIMCISGLRYSIFLFVLIGLMACGGGGGGDGDGGGGDTTAPQVSSVAPTDLSTDVTLDAEISVTFNESMDAATISSGSMTINPAVAGSVSYNNTAMRATFTPTVSLAASTSYTVTITTACTDAAGNPLAVDFSWSFTTGTTAVNEWVQVGSQVSPAGAESEDPTVLIVNDTPAVGYRHASFEINLHAWDGSTWGASATDPSGGHSNSSIYHTPSFCSNGSTIYMAYSREGGADVGDAAFYDRIFVHQWTSGSGWSVMNSGAEVSVPWNAIDGGADACEPAIGCSAGDLPWVAWEESNAASSDSDTDHSWVAEMTASGSNRSGPLSRNDVSASYYTDVRTVGIAVDNAGCSYVAQWESDATDQDRTDLYVTRYCGSSFTNYGVAVTDDYDYNNLSKPSMVIMGGELYIAYTRANDTDNTQHVYVKKYQGGAWVTVGSGPVSAFSASDHYDSGNPQLAVADGVLYVAWDETDQYDGPFIYVAYYDTAAADWVLFGDQLNMNTANEAQDPSLAYDAATGYLYVAFEENTDGWPHIFVKRKRHIP